MAPLGPTQPASDEGFVKGRFVIILSDAENFLQSDLV